MSRFHGRLPTLLIGLYLLTHGAMAAAPWQVNTPAPLTAPPTLIDPDVEPLPAGAVARLGTLRFRHGGEVGSVAVSPNGKLVASGGAYDIPKARGHRGWSGHGNNRICLWDAATGKLVREITAPGSIVSGLAFSPDGKTLAAASHARLCFIAVDTGAVGPTFVGAQTLVVSLRYAAGGREIVVFYRDGSLAVFAADSGEKVREWKPWADGSPPLLLPGSPAERFIAADLSVDGATLAVLYERFELDETGRTCREGGGDLLRLFDATGTQTAEIDTHSTNKRSLAFAPDGRTLVTVGAGIQHWDVVTETKVRDLQISAAANATLLRFSPDGKTLALADSRGDALTLWDVARGKVLYETVPARLENNFFFDDAHPPLSFSTDGKRLVGTFGDRVRIWDAASGKGEPALPGHQSGVHDLHFSPDGSVLSSRSNTNLCRWGTRAWKELSRVELHPAGIPKPERFLEISPDGKTYACQAKGDSPELRDTATGKLLRVLGQDGYHVDRALFSADGRRVALLAGVPDATHQYAACFYDVRSGEPVGRPVSGQPPQGVSLTADGATYVWAGADGTLNVADVATAEVVHHLGEEDLTRHPFEARTVISPNGEFVAWSVGPANVPDHESRTCPVRVFNLKTGRQVASWVVPIIDDGSDQVMGMAFSPDGRCLATVTQGEMTVRVWEVVSGQQRHQFAGHKDWALSAAFSPDGALLASGSKDGTILIWDLHGRALAKPTDAELTAAWDDLTAADGSLAGVAVDTLVRASDRAVTLLAARLQPVAAAEPVRVAKLIADLDSNEFVRRERASAELEALEGPVVPMLRAALRGDSSAEARRRLEAVLARLTTDEAVPTGAGLRRLRALEVLERIDSPAGRKLLEALGKGAPEARSTLEAKAVVARTARARAEKP